MSAWSADQIPDQTGRVAVVTGANSGLGAITARELTRRGAHAVLAVRTASKGEAAAQEIRAAVSGAQVEVRELDLSSLGSIGAFAAGLSADAPVLALLVNNAGIMQTRPAGLPTGSSCSSGRTTSDTSRSRACCSRPSAGAPRRAS